MGWTAWSWSNQPYLTEPDRRTATEFGSLVRSALIRHAVGDTALFEMTNIQAQFIGTDKATITWQTSVESDSKVLFGLTTPYTDSVYAPVFLISHSMKLTDLQPASTYHYKVISVDFYGNRVASDDTTFQTL
jgi:hypothetical protein